MIARDELENLKIKYGLYETGYFVIISIVYICTLVLIVPFVSAYTFGITDANYINYGFAYLLVLGEFVWAIRQPYNELIKAAGRFKETKVGSWIEAILNLVISIILVGKYGLVGIVIGTLIAMIYRTGEFVYYTNRHILNRSILISVKKILLILIETIICGILLYKVPLCSSYIEWFKYAIIIFIGVSTLVLVMNLILYRAQILNIIKIVRKR